MPDRKPAPPYRHALSVIIPFYDETAFIAQAVRSVYAQALDDVEILVVNDNPDKFPKASVDALIGDPRVIVVQSPQNQGLSAARNLGLAHATGEIIAFLDGDDYYTARGLARQFALAQESGADITHAQCYFSEAGTPEVKLLPRDRDLFGHRQVVEGLSTFPKAQFIVSSWSSLYRRDFLDKYKLRFDEEQPKFEDRLFVLHTVTRAKGIAFLGEPVRVWRRRSGSISVTETTPEIHLLQLQLLEKSLRHMRHQAKAGRLPWSFLRRETLNTVSRLIWDMDLVTAIAQHPDDPRYAEMGARIVELFRGTGVDEGLLRDAVFRPISRVGQRTRKGMFNAKDVIALHELLCAGDFAGAGEMLARARPAKSPDESSDDSFRPVVARRIVLHLGMHKTGSTSTQHHLINYRDELLEQGVLFPLTGLADIDNRARMGALPGHQKLMGAIRRNDSKLWEELAAEIAEHDPQTVIISCENMLMPLLEDRLDLIERLRAQLRKLGRVELVAMVRRPDRYVDSYYRELVSGGLRLGARSIEEFLVDQRDNLTNLPGLFGPLEEAFGTRVRLADFDAAAKADALWPVFQALCDLPQPLETMDVPRYASVDRETIVALRPAIAAVSNRFQREQVIEGFFANLDTLPKSGRDASLMPPATRLDLIDRFERQSRDWATERGYEADLEAMRQELEAEDWAPVTQISAARLERLAHAMLQTGGLLEHAHQPAPNPAGSAAVAAAESAYRLASDHHAHGRNRRLRVKLRPWAAKLMGKPPRH